MMLKTWGISKTIGRSYPPRAFFSQALNAPLPLPDETMEKVREQVHPTIKGRRRFYKHVGVRQVETIGDDGNKQFEVTLDGRALRSPGRRLMHIPQPLAYGIAAEWDAQVGDRGIEPGTMPLMSLTSTLLDQTAEQRELVIANVFKYLGTDTCCFIAEAELRDLVKRQKKAFTPIREWMDKEWECPLEVTDSVFKLKHPEQTMVRIMTMLKALDSPALTALQCATMESKSLALGLGVILRHIRPEKAQEACRLEEEIQMERWGLVEGGHDMDRVAGKIQLSSASVFLYLLDGEDGHQRRINHLKNSLVGIYK